MRAGETDKAVTVAPDAFQEVVAKIAAALPPGWFGKPYLLCLCGSVSVRG